MLMPSIFGEDLFDDWFDFPFYEDRMGDKVEKKLYGRHAKNLMKTDVKEKDKTVVSYDIGYYVLVNDEYLPLATKAGEDDEGLSLKELITGTDNYKIIEPANGNYFFTKDKINNLDSNLFFIIKATDNKNNEIKDAIKLKVTKISK